MVSQRIIVQSICTKLIVQIKINIMNKELIIRSNSDNVDFALLKEGKLIEYQKDKDNNKFSVGDVFIAKVRKSIPGLNAAFVNVGYKKDAFLHYHDLGPKFSTLQKFVKGVSSGKLKNYSNSKTHHKIGIGAINRRLRTF